MNYNNPAHCKHKTTVRASEYHYYSTEYTDSLITSV